ncbi:unnamed protein product [Arabidopsis halleri]
MDTVDDDPMPAHMKIFQTGKTVVFWDVEDCPIPSGSNAVEVSKNIRSVLVKMKYFSRASIYAYGNKNKIVDALEPAAVIVEHETEGDAYNTSDPVNMDYRGAASIYEDENHVKDKLPPQVVVNHSPGDKNARLRKILVNMFTWAIDNSSPANVMLILGDIKEHSTFLAAINRFKMKCYNVLFAQPENKSVPPNFPVSTKCLWETLSVGDLLIVQTEPVDNTLEGGRRSPIRSRIRSHIRSRIRSLPKTFACPEISAPSLSCFQSSVPLIPMATVDYPMIDHMKKYETAQTVVFWDVVDCPIPSGSNVVEVSKNIRSVLVKMKYFDRASIYAYGNKNQIVEGIEPAAIVEHQTEGDAYNTSDPVNMDYRGAASIYADENQDKSPEVVVNHSPGDACNTSDPVNRGEASIYGDEDEDESPEVVVNHSPGDKNARLRKILVNIFTWALDNPSPANVMLILGDIEEHHSFVAAVHRLQNKKCHNVLFAQPENKSVPLDFPISTKCLWETLSVGGLHIVQTEPVDNTLEGGLRSRIRRFFLLAGAIVCTASRRLSRRLLPKIF